MKDFSNTAPTRKQYLHVTAYPCGKCTGPVVSGSLGIRENVIARETEIMLLAGICLACGNRQERLPNASTTRGFFPVEWAY